MADRIHAGGVVAIDIGGSGSRAAWRAPDGSDEARVDGPRVGVAAGGTSLAWTVRTILARLREVLGADSERRATTVCIGATGLLGLTPNLDDAFGAAAEQFPDAAILIASDAVTATIGALGGRPGAVVAAGTGSIALGTDLDGIWHRVDGWGHVFGDRGSGAWIGAVALRVAAEHADGRRADAAGLLNECRRILGPPRGWPAAIYTNDERAGLLASLVPAVAALAGSGDAAAAKICDDAGAHLARTLSSALVPGVPKNAAWSGGLLGSAVPVAYAFRREFARLAPTADLREPIGTPLDGAVLLAQKAKNDPSPPAVVDTEFAAWRPASTERKPQ